MPRKIHLVEGLLATGIPATFALCERAEHAAEAAIDIGLDPEHLVRGGPIVRVGRQSVRSRLKSTPGWAMCTRCRDGKLCDVVTGEMAQLAGTPFLFLVDDGSEQGLVGGDHESFNRERRKLKLTQLGRTFGGTIREFFHMASTVESAVSDPHSETRQALNNAAHLIGFVKSMLGNLSTPTQPAGVDPCVIAAQQLGVRWPCSAEEVKAAYRREALRCHPDHGGSAERFKIIVAARQVLDHALGVSGPSSTS